MATIMQHVLSTRTLPLGGQGRLPLPAYLGRRPRLPGVLRA